jgi:hypothetical protein
VDSRNIAYFTYDALHGRLARDGQAGEATELGIRRRGWISSAGIAVILALIPAASAIAHDLHGRSAAAEKLTPALLHFGAGRLPPAQAPSDTAAPQAPADGCPTSVDSNRLADPSRLLALNRRMHGFGRRPTATPNHQRFVDWLEKRIRAVPGMRVRSIPLTIDRQIERRTGLAAGPDNHALRRVPVSGPVPYSRPTKGRGVEAPLVYVPPGDSIDEQEVAGRIVVRDAVPGSLPRPAFLALSWFVWDPDTSLTQQTLANYERDWVSFTRNQELEAAADAGAAGLIFVHGFPRSQVRDQYAPYNGVFWRLPGLYVGVDEGERLKQLAEEGGRARLSLAASREPAGTRTLVATLPGMSEERIAVTSHTDGINAVWDNGPIAMLAMAEHFAAVPMECRPRTLEFTFTSAHLYLTEATADDYAQELNRDYDKGKVVLAMALEHLGAREYDAVARPDGKPGRVIEPTGRSEPNSFFVGESPLLAGAVSESLVRNDLRRSIVLRGADVPAPRLPPHHSFGGEGTAYHTRLLPTIAFVTGPWTLFNPAFGMEAIDGELFHRQLVVFTDLVYSLDEIPREAIAGGYLAEREGRSVLCEASEDGFGLARCEDAGP